MVSPTGINLNLVEFKYYQFIISLDKQIDKGNGSCDVLNSKTCVAKKVKDINIKVLNMITNRIKARTTTKHFM